MTSAVPRHRRSGSFRAAAAALAGALVLAACGGDDAAAPAAPASAPSADPIEVVVTTAILGDVVQNLVQDDGTVRVLMAPGVDPHGYQASAADAAAMRGADLVIANGLFLEEGLISALEAAEEDGVRVFTVADKVDPIPFEFMGMGHSHGHDDHGHDDHGHDDHGHSHGHDEDKDDDHGHSHSHGHSHGTATTGEIGEFKILDRGADRAVVAEVHDDHWDGKLPEVPVGDRISLGAIIVSADGRDRDLSDPEVNDFGVELAEDAATGIVEFVDHGDHVHIRGLAEGETEVVFTWTHRGELRYTTPPIAVTVGDGHGHSHGDDHGHSHGHDDHDHGDEDPHFWWDPIRMTTAVDLIAAELADLRPEIDWAARASAYNTQVMAAHEQMVALFETVPAANRRIITNHDALGYLEERYGFEVIGTVIPGATTMAETNPRAFAELIDLVAAEGISVIFAENTDSTVLATQLASQAVDRGGVDVEVVRIFTDSLGEPGSGADTYLTMLIRTAELITEALAAA